MKKYPFKMQLSEDDCGAACVCMLIAKLSKVELSVGQAKYLIKNTDNGSTFLGIKKGLEKLDIYGEVAQLDKQKVDLYDMRNHVFITQINKNNNIHFVIIYKVKRNHLIIADPAEKKISKIKIDDFLYNWIPYVYYITNINNLNALTEFAVKKRDGIQITKILWENKGKIVGAWITTFFISLLSIISTFSFTFFFDTIIPLKLIDIIPYITFIFLFVLLFQVIINIFATKISIRLNNQIDLKITNTILESVFHNDFEIIENFKDGEIITRLQNVSQIRSKYIYWIIRFPIDIIMMLMTLDLLLQQNKTLTILLILPIMFSFLIVYITHAPLRDKSLALFNKGEKYNTIVLHILSSIEIIKSLGVINHYKNILLEKLKELKCDNEKFLIYSTILSGIKGSLLSLFSLCVLAIGSYYVITNKLGSGTLLMFNSLSMQILNPFMSIANLHTTYEQGKIAELKCEDLLHTKIYQKYGNRNIEKIETVSFENVQFEYNVGEKVLKNININFSQNQSYSITGLSGSGKTTFAKILAAYYTPTFGTIRINNSSILEYNLENIQKNILYVPQEIEIFPMSIMNNIRLGRPISEDIIFEKAKKLGFDDVIKEFSHGYETIIGENAVKLSMGQKQLLNILRSTLVDTQVIIFDEISNGLDLMYREKVIKYLAEYGNIKIFITHDIELANSCNQRFELQHGTFTKVVLPREEIQ